jgi:hypothetical protein
VFLCEDSERNEWKIAVIIQPDSGFVKVLDTVVIDVLNIQLSVELFIVHHIF